MIQCLIDTSSEVTVKVYEFPAVQDLGPFGLPWLSLKMANNLPMMMEGVTRVQIQIDDEVVEWARSW